MLEVSTNIETEPQLQPLSGESLTKQSANAQDDSRVDIQCRGFWCPGQDAFFDVRVFTPLATSNWNTPLSSVFRRHEQEKRQEYDQRIHEIEHGSFAPLIFAASGGMGALYHHSLQEACLSVGQQERSHVLDNHAVAPLPTVFQPPKISHHSHQRNKSVCPHPNPVTPPGYGGGQNRRNK